MSDQRLADGIEGAGTKERIAGEWSKVSEYCLSHPGGWTLAKCFVQGVAQYVLWQGDERKGQFGTVREAMAAHQAFVNPAGSIGAAPAAQRPPRD